MGCRSCRSFGVPFRRSGPARDARRSAADAAAAAVVAAAAAVAVVVAAVMEEEVAEAAAPLGATAMTEAAVVLMAI